MSSKRNNSNDSIDLIKSRSYSVDSRSYSIDSTCSGENIIIDERKPIKSNNKFFEKVKSPKRRERDSNSHLSKSPQLSDIIKLMEHFKYVQESIYHK